MSVAKVIGVYTGDDYETITMIGHMLKPLDLQIEMIEDPLSFEFALSGTAVKKLKFNLVICFVRGLYAYQMVAGSRTSGSEVPAIVIYTDPTLRSLPSPENCVMISSRALEPSELQKAVRDLLKLE